MEEQLQHFGVKGMKWGRHKKSSTTLSSEEGNKRLSVLEKRMNATKDRNELKSLQKEYGRIEDSISYSKPKRQNGTKKSSRIKEELGSLSRERQWKKVLDNLDTMSVSEMNKIANRIQMENDLKRLSRTIGNKDDKSDYRNRANISDADLNKKVGMLRAKDNLHRTIKEASKEQREIGMRVASTVGTAAVSYAITGGVNLGDLAKAASTNSKVYKNNNKKRYKDAAIKAISKYEYDKGKGFTVRSSS